MNRIIAIVTGLCLICQCMVQLGIVGWYQVNQEYIAQNLCENRDKPEMKCHGKCYLKKQLKKAGQQEQGSDQSRGKETIQFAFFILPDAWHSHDYSASTILKHRYCYHMPVSASSFTDIFHPPQQA